MFSIGIGKYKFWIEQINFAPPSANGGILRSFLRVLYERKNLIFNSIEFVSIPDDGLSSASITYQPFTIQLCTSIR